MGFLMERLEQPMSSGIGLANVRERLRVIYGASCQLALSSEPGKGTRARIEIPECHAGADLRHERRGAPRDGETAARPGRGRREAGPRRAVLPAAQREDVEVVAQAANGVDALDALDAAEPDIVFLDVQMPGLSGFEVARRLLERGRRPADGGLRHRLRPARHRSVRGERRGLPAEAGGSGPARQALEGAPAAGRRPGRGGRGGRAGRPIEQLARLVAGRTPKRDQVAMKIGERFLLVQAEDIVFASLADESITIVTGQVTGTSNFRTLDDLQARLDPAMFWRVHRSHLVNINQIKEIVPWFSRNYILRMRDTKGTEIPVSRSQTKRLGSI